MSSHTPQVKSGGTLSARKRHNNLEAVDVLVFIIPCLQLIRIKLIGVLNGTDLILLVIFLYLLFSEKIRIATLAGKWILALCSLWLVSLCVTDIVKHSAFADYARGWSNVGLTLVTLAVLWTLLYGRPQRLVLFGWGLVAGGLLSYFLNPNEDFIGGAPGDAWKFGFGYPVTLGVFLLASRKECRGHLPITLAVIMGVVNMVLGSRSTGGICLATALYLLVTRISQRRNPGVSKLKARTVVVLAVFILLSGAGVMWIYGRAASAGILGEDAQQKYEQQSSGKYGVLLGGRPELLAEIPAIYDSPILGHGSWAREPLYIIDERQALDLLGYAGATLVEPGTIRAGLIPAHSYFFQAWVDAGILGGVFWVLIFILTARALLRVYPPTTPLLPFVSLLAFLLLWSILFSPYGSDGRLTFPYSIVMMMTVMDMARREETQVVKAKNKVKAVAAAGRRRGSRRPAPRAKLAPIEGIGDTQ
jgi:O-antigen ligase